jgi:hypothetical protein
MSAEVTVVEQNIVVVEVSTGLQGATGPQGAPGATGATGATGAQGPQGDDGISAYQVAVDAGFVGNEAAWLASLVGATGATGADGDDGATGATGADGKTVRNGSGAPSTGLGVDGDFYIDPSTSLIYGPKASGTWPSGVSLIGATGAAGSNGFSVLNSAGTPSGGLGVNGDFCIDTTNELVYGPKTAGAWGSGTSLVGPTGATGDTGATGAAATISVGSVTTGAAGSSVSVTNAGTSGAAVFDFTIPRGDTGAAGETGDTGPQGETGDTGPQGPIGETGLTFAQQQFTGNGATTTFQLSATNTNDAEQLIVVLGHGSVQVPTTDYTVSDGLITFSVAPDNGQAISVTASKTGAISPNLAMAFALIF